MLVIFIFIIIAGQIYFFIRNILILNEFKNIFVPKTPWSIEFARRKNNRKENSYQLTLFDDSDEQIFDDLDEQTNEVKGINGDGNAVFQSIKSSINKYLSKNIGGIIDFGILKDTVERHCESVEDEINTQIPIPLYLGLAGTMIGAISGLWNMDAGTIRQFFDAGKSGSELQEAVGNLLQDVAFAMIASFVGILLTTVNTLIYKSFKKREERGKNDFYAWLQSKLLPSLPNSATASIETLSRSLNNFNNSFEQNADNLNDTLERINDVCGNISNIYYHLQQTDMIRVSEANIQILSKLEPCVSALAQSTTQIDRFNEYLQAVGGYLEHIRDFEQLFENQNNRLQILENLSMVFDNYKKVLANDIGEADDAMRTACKDLTSHTVDNVKLLTDAVSNQSDTYKEILVEQQNANTELIAQMKKQFDEMFDDIQKEFQQQFSMLPNFVEQLQQNTGKMLESNEKLISAMLKSNEALINDFANKTDKIINTLKEQNIDSQLIKEDKKESKKKKWRFWKKSNKA